jgi:O-acetyl-ADP-ribose deacetylase (regulator of RNase III)
VIFKEEKRNLFEVPEEYKLAHCISSDCAMGAGIAVEFQKRFRIKSYLLSLPDEQIKHPTSVYVNRCFNLITKKYYYNKPTLESLTQSVIIMKNQAELLDIKKIAMPRIGCGLDRLKWVEVKEMIKEVFKDTDIEILVCSL